MTWIELSLDTTHEAIDWVNTLLATQAYAGEVQVIPFCAEDESESREWAFTVRLYLPETGSSDRQIQEIDRLLSPLHRTGQTTELQMAIVSEKLASSNVIQRIGERFVVLAADASYPFQPHEIALRMANSLSFGSGFHPTTIAILKLIERHPMSEMNALDLGSGSGILSVAMAKLGATVLALDNDQTAVDATQDAIRHNGLDDRVTVTAGSLGRGNDFGHWMGGNTSRNSSTIDAPRSFDVIVANLLARIQVTLAPEYERALRHTPNHPGLLITSGFTTEYENEIHQAFGDVGLKAIDCERSDEWVAFVHQLRS